MLAAWLPSTGLLAVSSGTIDRISNLGLRQRWDLPVKSKSRSLIQEVELFWKSLESRLWTVMTGTSNKHTRKLYPVPLDMAHTTLSGKGFQHSGW